MWFLCGGCRCLCVALGFFVLLWCGGGLLIYNVLKFSFFFLCLGGAVLVWWFFLLAFAWWGEFFDFAVVFVGGWAIGGVKVVDARAFCYKTYHFELKIY